MLAVPTPCIFAVATFVALCAVVDIRERRIPNLLSGTAMVAGMLMNLMYGGTSGVLTSLAGFGLGAGILLAPFALGGIGAGDVKMMAAIGAFLGPKLVCAGLLFGMILGGLIMVVHLVRIGRLGETWIRISTMVGAAAVSGSVTPLRVSADAPGAIALPYAVPLGLGTLLAMWVAG